MSNSHFLGYDARERWLDTAALRHPSHSPETFLLRDGVAKVLSTDTLVWPSIFDLLSRERPPWIGPHPPFRESLDALRAALDGVTEPHSIVAASTAPLDRELLGWDVVDEGFISGLSDCGYTPEERIPLAQRWAPALNEHHLFRSCRDAVEFSTLRDARVREHAPFRPVALYLIE